MNFFTFVLFCLPIIYGSPVMEDHNRSLTRYQVSQKIFLYTVHGFKVTEDEVDGPTPKDRSLFCTGLGLD